MVEAQTIDGDLNTLYQNKIMLNDLHLNKDLINITPEDIVQEFEY